MTRRHQSLPSHFFWSKTGKSRLLTNDSGEYCRLTPKEFRAFARTGRVASPGRMKAMARKGFIRDSLDFDGQAGKWADSNSYLRRGPGLHIFVLTLRCDHNCVYCQAGGSASVSGSDMDMATARKCVDFALNSPGPGITIEFQGGEPLLNWDVMRGAVIYGERKARAAGKDIKFALVSNFAGMTAEKADFLIRRRVALCTSLDGPADLHDGNRPRRGGKSHALAVKWIKYFRRRLGEGSDCGPSSLVTVTRASLGREKEIVDEYAALGLASIFVRPLAPLGLARSGWERLACSVPEFSDFYRKALSRVIELNLKGVFLKEKTAFLIAKKALGFEDNNYVDLRCPCGAGLGQLAYNFNGDIYVCDEARMLARQGDLLFKAGNVLRDSYREAVSSAPVKACAAASNLEAQPKCARCVWRPYCGVCPVYNYATQGSLWGNMPANQRCRSMKNVFETVFGLMNDREVREKVFRKWLAA